jgi:hypothetical protein
MNLLEVYHHFCGLHMLFSSSRAVNGMRVLFALLNSCVMIHDD